MRENLHRTHGLVHSESVLLLLVRKGLSREKAYEVVQRNAMKVWREGCGFMEELLRDPEVTALVGRDEIAGCFDLERCLSHVDLIFERVLGP
jgi:adenylosuccinate lyase